MLDQRAEVVRSFNRFYTRQIGLLHKSYLECPFSLAEMRVLYELAHRDGLTATELSGDLDLDAGYLSRMLLGFKKRGYVRKTVAEDDARQSHLSLTTRGKAVFAPFDAKSHAEIAGMLARRSPAEQKHLVEAMRTIETILGGGERKTPYVLREHRPGDMGWVVHRHGALYFQEYGWDERFEALVAEIAAKFIQNFDPKRERCWIAERDGEIVGSIFLVRKSETVGKLRLLLVEPSARGIGLGRHLVAECIRFARQVGYRKVVLWTQKNLLAAIHLYEEAGFRLVKEEPHASYGYDLISQTWELKL
jgi:DNA-binding MarR family transcriptional regulator/N-acetylglutamate synthase-like GNAT family acetyltransferase